MFRMGNLQCGQPSTIDNETDIVSPISKSAKDMIVVKDVSQINNDVLTSMQLEQQFLRVHLSETKRKCILSTPDLIQAHVEQVDEFIRRSNDNSKNTSSNKYSNIGDDSTMSDIDNDSDEDGKSQTSRTGSVGFQSVNSFARISSYFAPTVVSAATEKAGNHRQGGSSNSTSQKGRQKRRVSIGKKKHHHAQKPRIVGGMEFVESEMTRKKIQDVVMEFYHQSWFQRSMYMISTSSSTITGQSLNACHNAKYASTVINDDTTKSASFVQDVETYSSVLHLRLKMKCYNYYKLHLLRRKPNHPFTLAIQSNIKPTPYSPESHRQKLTLRNSYHISRKVNASNSNYKSRFDLPDLYQLSDDSSESTSTGHGLDFGVGPPSNPIQLLVTDAVFMDIAITGSLGFNPKKQRPRAAYIDRKVLLSPDKHIILLNRRSGIPIAVCTLVTPTSSSFPVVRMYATKRRAPGQYPITTTGKLGFTWTESLPLYTWAEFITETLDPNNTIPTPLTYSIYYVSDNDDGETLESSPKYSATHDWNVNPTNSSSSSPIIKITGRTSREFQSSGCATISMCTDDMSNASNSYEGSDDHQNIDTNFWKLSVSQGIDPAIFICFTSFVDELLERTMRWHCEK